MPSSLQATIRAKLRPIRFTSIRQHFTAKLVRIGQVTKNFGASIKVRFRFRSLSARGLGVASAVGAVLLEMLLEHLVSEYWKNSAAESTKKQLAKMGPRIEELIFKESLAIANMTYNGQEAYATITVRVVNHLSSAQHVPPVIAEVLDYLDVRITSIDKNDTKPQDVSRSQTLGEANAGYKEQTLQLTWSEQVALNSEYQQLYNFTIEQLLWLEQRRYEQLERASYGMSSWEQDFIEDQKQAITDLADHFGLAPIEVSKHFSGWLLGKL